MEEEALSRLEAASSAAEIDALEREVLGNASAVGEARRGLRDLPEDRRREVGRGINEIATRLGERLSARKSSTLSTALSRCNVCHTSKN